VKASSAYQISGSLSIKFPDDNSPAYKKGILLLQKFFLIRRKNSFGPYLMIGLTHVELGEQLNTGKYFIVLRIK